MNPTQATSMASNTTDAQIPTGRQRVIEQVSKAVLSDRNKDYGNPEDNFKNIADVWNWWFETRRWPLLRDGSKTSDLEALKITPLDVAHMMTLMKMARLKTNPHHFDSIVDAAGYQACAGDFKDRKQHLDPKIETLAKEMRADVDWAMGVGTQIKLDFTGRGHIFKMDPRKSYCYSSEYWSLGLGATLIAVKNNSDQYWPTCISHP